jgi:hypothetical protein
MTRRSYEIDLPARVAEFYASAIGRWVETAIPGQTLCIPLQGAVPPLAFSPFVTSSSLERNTIVLRAVELSSSTGPCILVEPADALSRRLVAAEDKRLTPAAHVGGSRPLNTGTPAVGSLAW